MIDPKALDALAQKAKGASRRPSTPLQTPREVTPGLKVGFKPEEYRPSPWMAAVEKFDLAGRRAVGGMFKALRIPQQALIGAIHPRMTPGEAIKRDVGFGDILRQDLGMAPNWKTAVAGLALDVALDPLWVVTPAKLARVAGLPRMVKAFKGSELAKGIAASPTYKAIGRQVITDFGRSPEYVNMLNQHERAIARSAREAFDSGIAIKRLSKPEQQVLTKLLRAKNEATVRVVVRMAQEQGIDAKRVLDAAVDSRRATYDLLSDLKAKGAIDEDQFKRLTRMGLGRGFMKEVNPAKWLQELSQVNPAEAARFEAKLKRRAGFTVRSNPMRERLEVLRMRDDVPPALKEEVENLFQEAYGDIAGKMTKTEKQLAKERLAKGKFKGEVEDVGYLQARERQLLGKAVATRDLLNKVDAGFARVAGSADEANDLARLGYKPISKDAKALGPLAGKWVPEAVWDDLHEVATAPSSFMRRWKQGVGWWKHGKVAMNLAAQARNIMSNLILADFAGLQPWKVHRYMRAASELINQGPLWREAMEHSNFLIDTQVGHELPKALMAPKDWKGMFKYLQMVAQAYGKVGNKASDLYQFEERLFKMAVYAEMRLGKGMSPEDAARVADEFLFNYRRVPKLVETLRSTGIVPFVTFQQKALPLTARMVMEKPATVSKYGKGIKAIEESGEDPDVAERERPLLPEWMQAGWPRLPGRDEKGRASFWNINYILPFSDVDEIAGYRPGQTGPMPGLISSPYADLAVAIFSGRDRFTGREIEDMPGGWSRYLRHFFMPPLIGGSAFTEWKSTLKGQHPDPTSKAEPLTVGQVAARTLGGVQVRSMDMAAERVKRMREFSFEIRELRTEMKGVSIAHNRGRITDEEYEDRMRDNLLQMRQILKRIATINRIRPAKRQK